MRVPNSLCRCAYAGFTCDCAVGVLCCGLLLFGCCCVPMQVSHVAVVLGCCSGAYWCLSAGVCLCRFHMCLCCCSAVAFCCLLAAVRLCRFHMWLCCWGVVLGPVGGCLLLCAYEGVLCGCGVGVLSKVCLSRFPTSSKLLAESCHVLSEVCLCRFHMCQCSGFTCVSAMDSIDSYGFLWISLDSY